MNPQQQQIVDKLKSANNILVTVSSNPSADQLAACIGLTLLLNKLKKHATAVFSGSIPSTIEFLKPEDTIEKNTDSLRDFIIALDKSKADKLRYKVEENVVKIFITPYRTSISQDDLEFSQGDFNVDVVVALGVREQTDLDQAITAHGRILHDAVVASINTTTDGELGTINWTNPQASSLSELVTEVADVLGKDLVDAQIATALLTGIVAETNRFSNEKTSPETMRLSAELMAAGANQQLVATELQQGQELPPEPTSLPTEAPEASGDGTLEIAHQPAPGPAPETPQPPLPPAAPAPEEPDQPPAPQEDDHTAEPPSVIGTPKLMTEPPTLGGQLTASTDEGDNEPATDPLSLPEVEEPLLSRDETPTKAPAIEPPSAIASPPPAPEAPATPEPPKITETPSSEPEETLKDIEQAVHSPHLEDDTPATTAAPEPPSGQIHIDDQGNLSLPGASPSPAPGAPSKPDEDSARAAVMDAISSAPQSDMPEPLQATGAAGYLEVQDQAPTPSEQSALSAPATTEPTPHEPAPGLGPADEPLDMPLPPGLTPPPPNPLPPTGTSNDAPQGPPPPPVPPPFNPQA